MMISISVYLVWPRVAIMACLKLTEAKRNGKRNYKESSSLFILIIDYFILHHHKPLTDNVSVSDDALSGIH